MERGLIASIHPICLIDEYASRGRTWVCASPPKEPMIILIAPNQVLIRRVGVLENVNKKIRGVIFCHVDRIKHIIQGKDAMTLGNQKWQGAMPAFIIKDIKTITKGN